MEQRKESSFGRFEKLITRTRQERLAFTFASYILVVIIYFNVSIFQSPVIGSLASVLYFIINGTFLGHAVFKKEDAFFRLSLGLLLLITFLGFAGWLSVIIYKLDVIELTFVLGSVATISSLLSWEKQKNVS